MGVDRTIKLMLQLEDVDALKLKETIMVYNSVVNIAATHGFEHHTCSKVTIHHATYYTIREQFPELNSSYVQTARDVAAEALKGVKLKKLPVAKMFSAMRSNKNCLRVVLDHRFVSMATNKGRIQATFTVPKYYSKYLNWSVQSSTIKYIQQKNEFWLHLVMRTESPKATGNKVLGIDRGIVNVAVCSNNKFFNGKSVKCVRAKYAFLRQKLQAIGTKSAKRRLKKLSGSERRFVTDVNHCISKEIVAMPYDVFALEDLTSIRVQQRKGKNFIRKLNNWSFYQLEEFIRYKAEAAGKLVVSVDPRFSSQKCSRCGNILKENRVGNAYHCHNCGLQLHADINASRNIAQAGISCLSRLSVNQPNVVSI